MDNFFSPLSADSTTITDVPSKQQMGSSQNHPPLSTISCFCNSNVNIPICPLFPFCYCGNQQHRSWLLQTSHCHEYDKKIIDAYRTKVARSKRRLARQKSLISRNPPSSSLSSCPNSISFKKLTINGGKNIQESKSSNKMDLYTFCTPDDKKLRVLLKKELKNSDIGGLGRIVLPKREAEENLPALSDKDGIQVVIRDAYSTHEWSLKFKYWSNNKSRMYVLENTGDFVKQNGMGIGDSLTLYEDESKHLYFSVKKVEREETMKHTKKACIIAGGDHHHHAGRDEEEASLALLIEQLKHKEHQEHSLVTLSMELKTPFLFNNLNHNHNIVMNPATSTAANSSRDHQNMNMVNDDCYTGLGLLPDVHWYNFSV
ncbi:B3 domain-containing transcription factor LEC2 [Euphorbia peplus]|nr:B3 domain-containing transcription factor LEC2 [Euphorbia peplus]